METCWQVRGSERKGKKSNGEDMQSRSLSDFPDAILCHILSFLSTKTAVKTSVLSKRWQFIWTSLPSLDFEENRSYELDEKITKRNNFMKFVERALFFDNAPRLEKFSLSCRLEDDAFRIKTWIATAVRREARVFYLSFYDLIVVDGQHVFPRCLFSCEATEELKLVGNHLLLLPSQSQICLPRLRNLTLTRVAFEDFHELNLLFGCSTLEELVLDNCTWETDTPREIVISATRLQSLTIKDDYTDHSDVAASHRFTISAPVLRIFYYKGFCKRGFRFSCPSSIDMATLCFEDTLFFSDIRFDHFYEILRSLRFVKYLNLSAFAVAEGISHSTVPMFENLISLTISPSKYTKFSGKGLKMILRKCPLLKSLELCQGIFKDFRIDRLLTPTFTYLQSLKNLTIGICGRGDTRELVAVLVLLAEAKSLETMDITLSEMDESARKEFETFVCAIPRGSKSCKLRIN